MMEEKILSRGWDNVKAFAVALGNLSQADENAKKVLEELEGKVDLIVASSVLSFIPNEDIEETMKKMGRLLKPGGVFCHSDWPKSEAKHPDAMTDEKAARYFAMAGLKQEVGQIVKMDMGTDDQGMEVFVGVARKP
jgi:SAM-dependent methyltransferase